MQKIPIKVSKLFTANYNATKPIVINQGGTSSGKTYSILQVLIQILAEQPNKVGTVVGRDIPNLKVGAIRDFKNIWRSMPEHERIIKRYNGTDNYAEFYNGSILEFKSFGDEHDARGSRRDYAFLNEANGITWAIADQVMARTRVRTFIDFNPASSFWAHEEIMAKLPKSEWMFIRSTYKHNPFLSDKIIRHIENWQQSDPYKWEVYGLGQIGRLEGTVYNNWQVCDAIPEDAKLLAHGLDFGFSVDPAALIAVYRYDGELYVDELLYETGLINADIIAKLPQLGVAKSDLIICDSAEPKSIEELKRAGYYAKGVGKGSDSVRMGIDLLKQFRVNVSRHSSNLQEEFRNYIYQIDRSGKKTKPIDSYNHALDALRYVALEKLTNKKPFKVW